MDFQSHLAPSGPTRQIQHLPKTYAAPSEWESCKETIRSLYLEQKKTLREVQDIMAKDYGFNATTGMYKKRFKSWAFDKKLREGDVLEILHQKAERDTAGKTSKVVIRGRNVDFDKVRRYVESKPDILSKIKGVYEGTPSGTVVCRTPSPVMPTALPSTSEVRKLEEIMTVLRDYIRACAVDPQPRWIMTPNGYTTRNHALLDLCVSRSSMIAAWDEITSLHLSMTQATSPAEMFQVLDSSMNQLKDAMKDELPEFVIMMIYLLRFTWPGHPVLLQMFRKHVGELSWVILGSRHPLTLIWRDATSLEKESDQIIEEILHVLYQELAKYLGPKDDVVELARRGWRYAPSSLRGMAEVMKQYQNWLASHPNWPNSMLRSFLVQVRLMIANIDDTVPKDQLLEAHATIQTILDTQGGGQFPISPAEACSLAVLDGGLSSRLGNFTEAEHSFLMAADIAKCHMLPLRDEIISLRNLKRLYRVMGKRAELAKVTQELRVSEGRILLDSRQASR
ncbi:Clr5 domain-containing protein [Hypoxylon sp. NC1633]|nr:Clr5 domain-containing protein [Hypoxylon sp. NC1633]